VKFGAVLLALAWLCLATAARAERLTYTVAIGNNQPPVGDKRLAPLRYADDDAIRYMELLGRLPGRAWLLTSLDERTARRHPSWAKKAEAPTLARLREVVRLLAAQIAQDQARGAEPVVFLTYSGHGGITEQGEYFLSFTDGPLTRNVLYDEVLEPLKRAEVHLLIDSCHAGGVVGARGAFDHELNATSVPLPEADKEALISRYSLARFPNVGVLVATTQGQEAHEWSRIESGVFTYELSSALLGAADVNGDLRIEYSEVAAFIAAANEAIPNPDAVPELLARAPVGKSAVLIDLTQLERTLVLTGKPADLGKFYVELRDGERWLEAHLPAKRRVALALPLQSGSFLRTGDQEAEIPSGPARIIQFENLKFSPLSVASRGSIEQALRDKLFSHPFGLEYYRQFAATSALPSVDLNSQERALPGDWWVQRVANGDRASRAPAIALSATAGAAAVTALVSSYFAIAKYQDLKAETRQREAIELQSAVIRDRDIALVSGALSVVAGVGAWFVWPTSEHSTLQARGPTLQFVQHF
jgi:hypothetical protein